MELVRSVGTQACLVIVQNQIFQTGDEAILYNVEFKYELFVLSVSVTHWGLDIDIL